MMKSLRKMGRTTVGRAARISFSEPPKYVSSVSMERAAAPACWYSAGIREASAACLIQPFEGERRLNSAMMPVAEASRLCFRLLHGWLPSICFSRKAMETAFSCSAISMRLWAMISSKISRRLFLVRLSRCVYGR